jgi:hypothetical protein
MLVRYNFLGDYTNIKLAYLPDFVNRRMCCNEDLRADFIWIC